MVDERDDDRFMDEAFALAERGRGHTHPNPLVGALVVKDGVVVGRGYHHGPGTAHAEAAALAEAGMQAQGATLYATLEPCSHQGRTPPCDQAIIAAGVRRVVVALQDPNVLVDGRGLARLRGAGLTVDQGGGRWEQTAREQNAAFVKYSVTGLPVVTYKAAMSLDGKVAGAGGAGEWLSSLASRRTVHQLRAASDAVMVGAGTVRRDDPELTVRLAEGRDPVRVIVSRHGELPSEAKLLTTARTVPTIVLAERFDAAARRLLTVRGVETVEMGAGGLRRGLAALAERGLLDILLEGGPQIAGALFLDGLVDRLVVYVAPLLVGRGAPDLVAAPAVEAVADALRLQEVSWERIGDDLLLRARLPHTGEAAVPLGTPVGRGRGASPESEAPGSESGLDGGGI